MRMQYVLKPLALSALAVGLLLVAARAPLAQAPPAGAERTVTLPAPKWPLPS